MPIVVSFQAMPGLIALPAQGTQGAGPARVAAKGAADGEGGEPRLAQGLAMPDAAGAVHMVQRQIQKVPQAQ